MSQQQWDPHNQRYGQYNGHQGMNYSNGVTFNVPHNMQQFPNYQGQFYVPQTPAMQPFANYSSYPQYQYYNQSYHQGNRGHSNRGRSRGHAGRGGYHDHQRSRPFDRQGINESEKFPQGSTEFEIELENRMDTYLDLETDGNSEVDNLKTDIDGKFETRQTDYKGRQKDKGRSYSDKNDRDAQRKGDMTFTNSNNRGKRSYDQGKGQDSRQDYSGNYTARMEEKENNYQNNNGARPRSDGYRSNYGDYNREREGRQNSGYYNERRGRYTDDGVKNKGEFHHPDREYYDARKNSYSKKADYENKTLNRKGQGKFESRGQQSASDRKFDSQKSSANEASAEVEGGVAKSEGAGGMMVLQKQEGREPEGRRAGQKAPQPAKGHRRPPVLRTVSGRIDESQRGSQLVESCRMGVLEVV